MSLSQSWAGPASFSYQGQIIKPDGLALEAPNVQFTIEVRSPAPNSCLLYRERHTRNMSASNGIYNLQVGDGTRLISADPADTATLTDALDKSVGLMSGLTCASGNSYTPDANDDYELRVIFNDGLGPNVVAQNHVLRSVPYAMSAQSLNGLEASDLLQVNEDPGFALNQANLESVFTDTNYPELMALLNGTSTQYLSALPGAPFSMNSQRITDLANPTAATDAANKNYVDSYIGGSVANGAVLSTLGAGQAGQVLTWDGNEWTVSTPSMIDATKLPLAGGTMAGAIDMNGNNLVSAGAVSAGSVATTGAVTIGDSLSVTNGASVGQGLSVGQNLTVTGNASVGGNSTLTGDLSVTGQTSLDQDLLVSGGIGVTNGISSDNYIILNNENELRFGDAGSNYVGFKGPAAAAGAIIWELPGSDGSAGQVLATDGFGQLSWIDPSLAAPVSSVYGRTGAVVAQAGDYNASQVSNAPAGNIGSTTVQAAINELDTEKASVTALSALDTRVGTAETNITGLTADLAATDAAVAGLDTRLDTAETDIDNLEAGLATTNTNVTNLDNAKVNRNGDTMTGALNLDNQQQLQLSEADGSGANFVALRAAASLAGNTVWTLPLADGGAGEVLSTDGAGNLSFIAIPSAPVSSVYGRTGAVVAQAGDYNAGQVTSTPVGDLSATDVQAALTELDSEKASVASLAATDAAVTALDGRVSANETAITALGGRMTAAEAELVAQDGRLDTAETDIDGLDTRLTLAEGSLANLGTDYTALESRVDTAETDINALETSVNGLTTDLATTNTNVTNLTTSKVNRAGDTMTGALQMNAQTELRLADSDSSNYVGLRAPASIGSNYVFTLPTTDGDAGQVLETDGNGVLTWKSLDAVGETNVGENLGAGAQVYSGKSGSNLQFRTLAAVNTKLSVAQNGNLVEIGVNEANLNSSLLPNTAAGNIAATNLQGAIDELDTEKVAKAGDTMTGSLSLANTAQLRLGDADNSNYVGFVAPAILGTNLIWELPTADGSSGQMLTTNGAGQLAWASPPSGADNLGNHTATTNLNMAANSILSLGAGTSADPSLSFSGDSNTGLFSPAADQLGFSTAGTNRLFINATGQVGIGTTNPADRLELDGDIRFTRVPWVQRVIRFNNNNGNPSIYSTGSSSPSWTTVVENDRVRIKLDTDPGGTDWFDIVDNSNNRLFFIAEDTGFTGVGDGSPEANLEVSGNGTVGGSVLMLSSNDDTDGDIMNVLRNGNVAIGTTAPTSRLEVGGTIVSGPRGTATGEAGAMRLRELTANGSNFVSLRAPDALAADLIWTLPATDGTAGQVLSTNGAGVLSWASLGGGGDFLASGTVAMTGQLRGTVGSASAPSYSFSSDLDSGLFSPAADQLGFSTGGSERLRVTNSGTVGIGTDSPRGLLDVRGTSFFGNSTTNAVRIEPGIIRMQDNLDAGRSLQYVGTSIRIGSNNSVATGYARGAMISSVSNGDGALLFDAGRLTSPAGLRVENWGGGEVLLNFVNSGGTSSLFVNSAHSNLGVGNSNPSTSVDASGAITSRPFGTSTGQTGQLILRELAANGTNTFTLRAPDSLTANRFWTLPDSDGTSGQVLSTNGSGALSWTTVPTSGGTFLAGDGTVTVPSISFSNDTNTGFYRAGGDSLGITVGGINHGTMNMNEWRLWRKIQTGNCDVAEPCFGFSTDTDTGVFNPAANSVGFSTGGTERMRVNASGDVGIGITTPGYRLDVQGGDINASGSVRSAGVALTSDIRYKKDIQELDQSLEKLLTLRGVSYSWRTEEFPEKHFNQRKQVGVIAQEVEKQFPELVDTNKDGYKSVNYPALVAPIIEAIRTLYDRLVASETELSHQERRLATVEANQVAKSELERIKEENLQLKAEAEKQRQENAVIKAWICQQDPKALVCP